ncbi:sigma-54 interaction domain-containing protein [Acidobacteriota bacterium]
MRLPVLKKLIELIMEEIPSGRVFVLLVDSKHQVVFKKSLESVGYKNSDINPVIIKEALELRNPVIVNNLKSDPRFKDSSGLIPCTLDCVLYLPFMMEHKPTGVIYLDRSSLFGPYSPQNVELLIALSMPISKILKDSPAYGIIKEEIFPDSNSEFLGRSKSFRQVLFLIDKVKDSDAPVLIWGESGTGKELVARTIHQTGIRKNGRFVALNCGAIPEHLLESELFGYARGAFTGAVKAKPGLIEEANGGTLFLDEIGDLFPSLQAKLLRVLQEKEIRRVGENRVRNVDVRFISATNKDIEKEIEKGMFREDLYYRLNIITIEIASLRERKEDIPYLLNHFVEVYCNKMKRQQAYFSPRTLELLLDYSWPGNVRELQNEVQKCLLLCSDKYLIK